MTKILPRISFLLLVAILICGATACFANVAPAPELDASQNWLKNCQPPTTKSTVVSALISQITNSSIENSSCVHAPSPPYLAKLAGTSKHEANIKRLQFLFSEWARSSLRKNHFRLLAFHECHSRLASAVLGCQSIAADRWVTGFQDIAGRLRSNQAFAAETWVPILTVGNWFRDGIQTAECTDQRQVVIDLTEDAYWRYYADCDRWEVVFVQPYFQAVVRAERNSRGRVMLEKSFHSVHNAVAFPLRKATEHLLTVADRVDSSWEATSLPILFNACNQTILTIRK